MSQLPPVPGDPAPAPGPAAFDAAPAAEPVPPLPAEVPPTWQARPAGLPDPEDEAARVGRLIGILVGVPLVLVVTFLGGMVTGRFLDGGGPAGLGPEQALILEAWDTIHEQYVDPGSLDDRELAYAAIRAMAEAVGDENHTMFLTPEELAAAEQSLSGSFVGVGVQVDGSSGALTIEEVIPSTPAEEAGLARGDVILAVDGRATAGRPDEEVVGEIRGPEGEPVVLTIRRAGRADFDVRIVRRKFDLPNVTWSMVPGRRVALVRIEQFASGTVDGLKAALADARAAGATSLVLDMRGNPGGYVSEAVGVASQFLSDGAVYQAVNRAGTTTPSEVQPGGVWTDLPVVVLVDGDTASAAEIVTGALQDADRAQVVGETTFGTGTVLGSFSLEDGSSLRIGMERWLTRDGRPIWREGLVPDVTVAIPDDGVPLRPVEVRRLSESAFADATDAQLLRALELLAAGR